MQNRPPREAYFNSGHGFYLVGNHFQDAATPNVAETESLDEEAQPTQGHHHLSVCILISDGTLGRLSYLGTYPNDWIRSPIANH